MKTFEKDRRDFMKKAGSGLLATAAGSTIALSALQAHAGQSAVTPNQEDPGRNHTAKSSANAQGGQQPFRPGKHAETQPHEAGESHS